MTEQPKSDKKIIVDEDWKEEAQREKETLAAALEQEKEAKRPRPPEQATFALLVTSLATQALASLGEIESPFTGKRETNLPEARFQIDILEMLEAKTKGNLTPEEGQMLEGLLFDLRMRFVAKGK